MAPEKPGRPASFHRDQAIEAAMHLLWEKGFPAVTARDLAAAMSIQRSSFYNSFGSREAVFCEALERYAEQAPDGGIDRLLTGEPALPVLVEAFRAACAARASDTKGRGCLVCSSVASLVGVDEQLGPLLATAVRRRIKSVVALLEQAVEQGEFELSGDVPATARQIVAFLMGLNTLSKVVRDGDELWLTCKTFLTGLGVPPKLLADSTGVAEK